MFDNGEHIDKWQKTVVYIVPLGVIISEVCKWRKDES